MKAYFLRKIDGWRGDVALYRLEPRYVYRHNDFGLAGEILETVESIEYVLVSAIDNYLGFETYIFPSNKLGECCSWVELPGSLRCCIEHRVALKGLGYELVEQMPSGIGWQKTEEIKNEKC